MSGIRDELHRAVGAPEAPVDLDHLHRKARRRRTRRRVAQVGLGSFAGLAVAGIGWVAVPGGLPGDELTIANEPAEDTGSEAGEDGGGAPGATTSSTTEPTGPGSTTTTEVPPTTDTTVPQEAVPEPPVEPHAPEGGHPGPVERRVLVGTFRGESLPLEATPGSCTYWAHRLDAVFTLDTGETWAYRADYCGRRVGSRWDGEGTFTFTTAAGDTIGGTFASSATLPTEGEPYVLTVSGGTGAWSGATGRCDIDNNVMHLPNGMLEQSGPFTCDLSSSTSTLR